MSDMYHYKQTASEADLEWKASGIWTVGHYEGDQWQPESDHGSEKEAAARTQFLNGDPEAYGGRKGADARLSELLEVAITTLAELEDPRLIAVAIPRMRDNLRAAIAKAEDNG